MKSLKVLIGAAAIAAAYSVPASAAQICNGCNFQPANPGTYVGSYVSTTFDFGSFINASPAGGVLNASFTDTYVFDFNPGGSTSMTASFTPNPGGIGSFTAHLYSLNGIDGGSSTCTTFVGFSSTPTTCSAVSLGSLVTTGITAGASSQIGNTPLLAGRYAFVVTGQNTAGGASNYTGNMSTNPVPEPGTLALVGVALFGLAAGARKRKSV